MGGSFPASTPSPLRPPFARRSSTPAAPNCPSTNMGSSPTDAPWYALIMDVSEDRAEAFTDLAISHGAQGLSEDHPGLNFDEDPELYVSSGSGVPEGKNPTGRVRLTAIFPGDQDPESLLLAARTWSEHLEEEDFSVQLDRLEDRDWNAAWKEQWESSLLCPGVLVVPAWLELPELLPGQQALRINPGLAFGTGTHSSTILCAELAEKHLRQQPGARVLDVGTGTGILAIAALLLGASGALGLDTDEEAVAVANSTAQANGVSGRFDVQHGSIDLAEGTWDLVFGNLLAHVVIELAAPLSARVASGGSLVVSGILVPQADSVEEALAESGMVLAERRDDDEWTALRFVWEENR
ncbi:MAG: 50S ribosomal protein L11 methyltransferase [Myxococcota bacterium]|nr:50S ribosomal protein L11 methyltransferase [Myxococcota bacterium]